MSKKRIILHIVPILAVFSFIIGALIFFYSTMPTDAALTGDVTPTVSVLAGGSLTVSGSGMAYGDKAAGTNTPYNGDSPNHVVTLVANTNTTTWGVTVTKDHDLRKAGPVDIASTNFQYTSVAGPAPAGTPTPDYYGPLAFGAPSNVFDTPGTPAAAVDCKVDVRYDLTIPVDQANGAYTATHTYTLLPT